MIQNNPLNIKAVSLGLLLLNFSVSTSNADVVEGLKCLRLSELLGTEICGPENYAVDLTGDGEPDVCTADRKLARKLCGLSNVVVEGPAA